MTAPVLLVFYSRTRMPESGTLADDLHTLSDEFEGRFLPVSSTSTRRPRSRRRCRSRRSRWSSLVAHGRPMPLLQDAAAARRAAHGAHPGAAAADRAGRHRPAPAAAAAPAGRRGRREEPRSTRATPPAQDALGEGDIDARGRGVPEARRRQPGRRRGRCRPGDGQAAAAHPGRRPQRGPRRRGRDAPDDVDAQTMVADLDMLGGHVEDAFNRLIDLVRRTPGDERDRARDPPARPLRAVGNDDPRVIRGRQNLASALF